MPFIRPSELSTDTASSLDVVIHSMYFMEERLKLTYDAVLLLQPTTPFRQSHWIDTAIQKINCDGNLDSVVSVVDVGANHPYRMYTLDDHSYLEPFVSVSDPMMPRQMLPPVFIRIIYLTKRECLVKQKSLIGSASAGLVIDASLPKNIDTADDLLRQTYDE